MTRVQETKGTFALDRSWVDTLRTSCMTLLVRPGVVNTISVSRSLSHDWKEEGDAVIALARHLGGEYGLLAETDVQGDFVTIRFTTQDELPVKGEPPRASLFDRVRGYFGRSPNGSEAHEAAAGDAARVPVEVR
jgi:hypothetical protein